MGFSAIRPLLDAGIGAQAALVADEEALHLENPGSKEPPSGGHLVRKSGV
jgi:hypothetical protein